MKFSSRLILIFAGVIFVTFGVLSYFVYLSTSSILETQIKDQLKNHAVHMTDKIDRVLYNKYIDVKFLASDPVMRSHGPSPARLNARLKEFIGIHKTYASASFFDMNRVRVADTAGKEIGRTHPPAFYWKDLAAGKEFAVNVSQSASLKENVVHFAHVVRDGKGAASGVVVARMPVERLFEMLEPPSGSPGVHEMFELDLVDKDGLILYSNHNEKAVLKEVLPDWDILKGTAGGETKVGTLRHGTHGTEEIYIYSRQRGFMDFKGAGWTLIWDVPEGAAFAPIVKLRKSLALFLFLSASVMLFVLYIASRRVTRPLERLSKVSIEVGGGNLDAPLEVDYRANDEIGVLIGAFRQMVAGLRESRARLIAYSREIEAARASLAEAQRIAHLGNWDWDIPNNTVRWSDEIYRIFGLKPQEFGATYEAFISSVHPEDRDIVKQAVFNALYKKRPYCIDHRIVLPDKTERIVHEKAEVGFDNNGAPLRMMGTVQDVTARKEAETKLLELNSELQAALDRVKLLSGMLPICSSCKKIRDDKGYWNQIEEYIRAHSEAEFTHGFCPECAKKLYPGIYKDKDIG